MVLNIRLTIYITKIKKKAFIIASAVTLYYLGKSLTDIIQVLNIVQSINSTLDQVGHHFSARLVKEMLKKQETRVKEDYEYH